MAGMWEDNPEVAPPETPPNTVGYTYHGLPGPAHKAHGIPSVAGTWDM